MQLASAYGKLGNIDANTGDAQTGWDTDQFLTDPKEALLVAATILKQGGLAPGASSNTAVSSWCAGGCLLCHGPFRLRHADVGIYNTRLTICMRQDTTHVYVSGRSKRLHTDVGVLRRGLQQVASTLMQSCEGRARL